MKGVFVIGAGPAGMFAARQIALAGYETYIFNRDIRPGGLAQFGIYPLKTKMKFGLQKQFAQVLEMPNVHYFGHVQVGSAYDVTLEELEAMRPAAIVFACGAQGAKKLGLPGEDAKGVYAAKDFVYHYNQLAPYVSMDFSTGKRIAIVGVGNVAIDIARWLLLDDPDRQTESVVIIARRGPLEVKFDKKEIEFVDHHVSPEELAQELERVKDRCAACHQDVSPETVFGLHFPRLNDPSFTPIPPRLSFRFLSSPKAILPDGTGRVAGIEVSENNLVLKDDGSTTAGPSGESTTIPVDTVLFAIGDKHDPKIGLPMGPEGYATRPDPDHPGEPSYEVWNPATGSVLPGRFVVGWARKASTGLAGIARHDGESGARKAIEFLKDAADPDTLAEPEIRARLEAKGVRTVTKLDIDLLARAEGREAPVQPPSSFTFPDNDAMFKAIAEERERANVPRMEEARSS
ncbi:MAG: FAD-dependent oxidoreductase [Terracidiphilus sp.]|jgi:ferredoxin--NADP+ reductase